MSDPRDDLAAHELTFRLPAFRTNSFTLLECARCAAVIVDRDAFNRHAAWHRGATK